MPTRTRRRATGLTSTWSCWPGSTSSCDGTTANTFQVCTTHIRYGGSGGKAERARLEEVEALRRYLKARSRYDDTELLLMGDFNHERPDSPLLSALTRSGAQIPDELLLPLWAELDLL